MGIKVEKINDKLFVIIPPEYKEPWWIDTMYKDTIVRDNEKRLIVPTRPCTVQITKPIYQQSPMGMIQTKQSYVENWIYFDVPQLSLLVKEGEDLLDTWSIEDLKIELKEIQQLEGEKDESKNIS